MEKIKKLLIQYQAAILYLIFGGLTTIVNIIIFAICYKVLHADY